MHCFDLPKHLVKTYWSKPHFLCCIQIIHDHTVYSKKIYRKPWFWGILTYSSVFRKLAGKPVSDIATSSIMLCHASRLFPLAASPAKRLGLLVCGSFCCRSSNHNAPPLRRLVLWQTGSRWLVLSTVAHGHIKSHIYLLRWWLGKWCSTLWHKMNHRQKTLLFDAFCALFRLKRDRWIHESQAQQSKRT